MTQINLVAIDLAKNSFHVRAVNHAGKALINRKVHRDALMETIVSFPRGIRIAMEACATSHFWGRSFEAHGYKVSLIAPQYVKPFVKSQKNDKNDAQGIADAASRDGMRFVPVKSIEQQDIQSLHRVRERYHRSRTALMNELRGLLMEYGFVTPTGRPALGRLVPLVFESTTITDTMKALTHDLWEELLAIEARLSKLTKQIESTAATNDVCRRLMTIPGIGEITASALYAAAVHMKFKNGRQFAAFLGLVPRQSSTGGKEKLGKITKHGDKYVRKLLVHGARSVLQQAHRRDDQYNSWALSMRKTKGYTKGAVAVANRNARIAWAIMSSDASFKHDFTPATQQGGAMVH